jgi:Fe-S-cluster containining protein
MPGPLPIIESCEDCGACCRVVTLPPFRRVFDEGGEEAWERLRWDRPDLRAEFLEVERTRKLAGEPSFGSPCLWFDSGLGVCRHYDYRPQACRDFAVGGVDCLGARRRSGVG